MISAAYPTKGTACDAAKKYAEQNKITSFLLLLDFDQRKYHFSDQELPTDSKLIVFGRRKLIKGKWQDKMPTGRVKGSAGGKAAR